MMKYKFTKKTLNAVHYWLKALTLKDEKEYEICIKEVKKKRSINANNYCWALISQIATLLKIPKEDVYRGYIRDLGVCKTIEVNEKAVSTMVKSWNMHGTGWVADVLDYGKHEGFKLINLYYGSSCYNTLQMSRFIDAIVTDCKELGIETATPQELALLKEKWNGE